MHMAPIRGGKKATRGVQSASSDAGVVAISSRDVIIVFVPSLQTRLFQPTSRNSAPRDSKAASPEL